MSLRGETDSKTENDNQANNQSNKAPWIGVGVSLAGLVGYIIYDQVTDASQEANILSQLTAADSTLQEDIGQSIRFLSDKVAMLDTAKMDTAFTEINGEEVPIWYGQGVMIDRNTNNIREITRDMEIYRKDIDGNKERIDALVGDAENQMSVQDAIVVAKGYTDQQIARIEEWNRRQDQAIDGVMYDVRIGFEASGIDEKVEEYGAELRADSLEAEKQRKADSLKAVGQDAVDAANYYIEIYKDTYGGFMRWEPSKLENSDSDRNGLGALQSFLNDYNAMNGTSIGLVEFADNDDVVRTFVINYIDNHPKDSGDRMKMQKGKPYESFDVTEFTEQLKDIEPPK